MKGFIVLLMAILPFFGWANNPEAAAKVSGTILDENSKQPIEFATISVHSSDTEELVTGTIADENGNFTIEKLKRGVYFIRIGFIGYETREINLPEVTGLKNLELGSIYLRVAAENLAEVEITGEKKVMETFIDKKVFNVSKDPNSQGGTGMDALKNVPGVEVDVDGNISLRGDQGVRILLDGRPLSMTPSQFFEQISSSSIERIEIITNPSAKYDPEGTTGILNVILKKEDRKGLFGNVNLGGGYGWYPKFNNSASINYRSGKWSLNGSLGSNLGKYGSRGNNDRNFFGDVDDQVTEDEGNRDHRGYNGRLGVDYFMTDKDIIYGQIGFRKNMGINESELTSVWTNPSNVVTENSIRNTEGEGPSGGMNFNLGYQKKFNNPNHTLDIDWSMNANAGERENHSHEQVFNGANQNEILYESYQDQYNADDDYVMQTKVDYVLPITDSLTLEAGYMHTLDVNRDIFLLFNQNYNPDNFADDTLFNDFEFQRSTHAAYGILSKQTERVGVKAGLRVENTQRVSELAFSEIQDRFNYLSAFPSFHLSYKLTGNEDIIVSASRRLNRPRSHQLNPFGDYSNPYTLRTGNPYLKPEFIQVYELGYLGNYGKVNLSATVYYRHMTDMIRRVLELDENNVNLVTFTNQDRAYFYGTEWNLSYNPNRKTRFNLNVNVYENRYDKDPLQPNMNTRARTANFNLLYSQSFEKDWQGQITGRYRAPMDVIQGRISGMGGIDFSLRKSFWDKKGSLGVRVSDIFNMRQFTFTSTDIGYFYEVTRDWESRTVFLNFSYNFGKRMRGPQRKIKRESRDSFDRPDF